jgi:hypothetical protein
VPLATVAAFPHTVTGAVTGAVVPLPEPGPLLLPLPVEPVFAGDPPAGPDDVPQVPFDVPLAAVTELPHTVTGADTGAVVPLPDTAPLLLPLPVEPVVGDDPPPGPDERSPHVPFDLPLPAVTALPQTVTGAPTPRFVPLPDTGPLWLPLPLEPVRLEPPPPEPEPAEPALFPQVPLP